jgi:hypothetical protein
MNTESFDDAVPRLYIVFSVFVYITIVVVLATILIRIVRYRYVTWRMQEAVLVVAILLSILASLCGLAIWRAVQVYSIQQGMWNYLLVRAAFFVVSVPLAWITYIRIRKKNYKRLAIWAFLLENIMLASLVMAIFALVAINGGANM